VKIPGVVCAVADVIRRSSVAETTALLVCSADVTVTARTFIYERRLLRDAAVSLRRHGKPSLVELLRPLSPSVRLSRAGD